MATWSKKMNENESAQSAKEHGVEHLAVDSPSEIVSTLCSRFIAATEAAQNCPDTEKRLANYIMAKRDAWGLEDGAVYLMRKMFGLALAHPQGDFGAKDIDLEVAV